MAPARLPPPEARPQEVRPVTSRSVPQRVPDPPPREAFWAALRERASRGLMLFNRERDRIHRFDGDLWAVPSSMGGFWRVNVIDETCGCPDFRYQCTDPQTGEPFMACKHIVAAAIAVAKARDRRRRRLAALEDRHRNEIMDPDERLELWEEVSRLRRAMMSR